MTGPPSGLADLTLTAAASGEATAAELVEACLARIEQREHELRAFITICADEARRVARRRDRERAAARRRGPLHGVPVAVKDTIDTAGIRTTGASPQFAARVPVRSAVVVERLERAGAIVIGKTNAHELGLGAICAPTRNAHDPGRLPGSSSGGSAVAVAAGMAFAALGTDTGGSIRIPAAFNGVVGLKPTFGWIPRAGTMPLSWSLDHVGPITRTVADAACMLGVLAGHDRRPNSGAALDCPAESMREPPRLRVGVPAQAWADPVTPAVEAAFSTALDVLAGFGTELVEVDLPALDLAPAIELSLVLHEAATAYRRDLAEHPERFGVDVRELLERGRSLSKSRYVEAQASRALVTDAVRGAFDTHRLDALAMPTTEATAPSAATSPERLIEAVPVHACVTFNLTGQPAISVPAGVDPGGMPIGLMLAGRRHQDAQLLRVAHAYELRREVRCRDSR